MISCRLTGKLKVRHESAVRYLLPLACIMMLMMMIMVMMVMMVMMTMMVMMVIDGN